MVNELKRKFIKTAMLVVTILLVVFLAAVNLVNLSLSYRDERASLDQIVNRNVRQMPGNRPGEDMAEIGKAQEGPAGEMPGTEGYGMTVSGTGAPGLEMRGTNPPGLDIPESKAPGPEMPEGEKADGRGLDLGRYFVVRTNASGEVEFSDLTHHADISEEEMTALVKTARARFMPESAGEMKSAVETETEPLADMKEGGGGNGPAPKPPAAAEGIAPKEERGRIDGYLYYVLQQEDGSICYAFLDVKQDSTSMLRVFLITAALGAALWFLILLLVVFLSKKAIAPIAENIEKQRQFITNAGHEIKTPLAVIVSNVDVQELHCGKTKWLDHIRDQALRLSDLTKQMLTLAKMEESGMTAFTSVTFDASRALEEAVRLFEESASLRGIRISTRIEPEVSIHFPREQYQQMLELLLDNAVKYGKENGFLSVTLQGERKAVSLSFRNDCDTLPDIDPDRLFDRFYRSDTSRSRKTGGSGIGLAVVRAIAQQGGGNAKAQFLPGEVIEFQITLPKRI